MVQPIAATPASWAYEARQEYLRRNLKFSPFRTKVLVIGGQETGRVDEAGKTIRITGPLWTGLFDDTGLPIPAENPAWLLEVWPIYNSPDPLENKRRSLRDTLIVSPESGPRLVAAGLWSGQYDDEGLPVP